MQRYAVLLSGDHATLPAAELSALVAVHAPGAHVEVTGLAGIVTGAHRDPGIGRMALASQWGELWGEVEAGDDRGLLDLVAGRADGRGSMAVTCERRGLKKNPGSMALQREVGAALKAKGHKIDLEKPERTLFLWLLDDRVLVGERQGRRDASLYDDRAVERRMHFAPVSLHPARAATLVHLARVPLQVGSRPGRLFDPFCGTGGIVLEAALEGYDAWGSDLDAFMVQGTLEALADAAPAPLHGTAFQADIGEAPRLIDEVDAIVTDMPYGRAATTAGEGTGPLVRRALEAAAALLRPGDRAVVGFAEERLLDAAEAQGFVVRERHVERMHRSLTRHFAVLQRR
ncbi:MAG: hypothetical protein ACYDBQ_07830 [Thermoplasmatota archaeon]